MEKNTSYILVGLFVISALCIVISTTLWLAFGGTKRIIYNEYETYMDESVSGLNKKALVKYLGVEVGRIKEISLNLDKPNLAPVRLTLEIIEGTPIKEDTYATLTSQGITGLTYLELSAGSHQASPLKAANKHELPIISSRPSVLMRLDAAMTEGFNKFNKIAEHIDQLITPNNLANVKKILSNIELLTRQLQDSNLQLQQSIKTASASFENIQQATNALPTLVQRAEQTLRTADKSIDTFTEMSLSMEQTSEELQQTLAPADKVFKQINHSTLPQLSQLITHLGQLVITYRQLGQQLQQTPNSLIFGRKTQRGPGE